MPKHVLSVRLHLILVAACCCLVRTSSAQFTRPNFSGRQHVSIAALDDFLYIHGGQPADASDNKYYDSLVINLKGTWPTDSPTISPLNWAASAVQMLGHRVWGFQLWKTPGSNSLRSWGGIRTANVTVARGQSYPGNAPLTRDVFVLATDNRGIANWSPETPAADPGDRTPTDPTTADKWGPGLGYSVSCAGYGIYLGGIEARPDGATPPFGGAWPSGTRFAADLVTYELATKKWARQTAPADAFGGAGLAGGAAVCLPHLGERGLVLFLGGHAAPPAGTQTAGDAAGRPLDLGRLVMYDPVTREWLLQAATGDVPAGRRHFCAVGVRSASGGRNSTEIYLYGGESGGGGPVGDLYVLSLPAVNWWRVLHGELESSGHACEVVGQRQMVILGGKGVEGANGTAPSRNPMGLRIFDLGTQSFVQDYSPAGGPYGSPANIKTWYSDGNLDNVKWNNDLVKATMLQLPRNTSSDARDSGNSSNTGAIVGGVVGGVALLALAGIAAWFFIRRRRNRYKAVEATDTAAAAAAHPASSDGPAGVFLKPELDTSPDVARSELASMYARSPELGSVGVSSATAPSWAAKSAVSPWTAASEVDSRVFHELPGDLSGAELQGTRAGAELPGTRVGTELPASPKVNEARST